MNASILMVYSAFDLYEEKCCKAEPIVETEGQTMVLDGEERSFEEVYQGIIDCSHDPEKIFCPKVRVYFAVQIVIVMVQAQFQTFIVICYRSIAEAYPDIFYLGDKFSNFQDKHWYIVIFFGQSSWYFGVLAIIWVKNLMLTFNGYRLSLIEMN